MSFDVIDPSTGKRLRSFPAHDSHQIAAALTRARDSFAVWRRLELRRRLELLLAAAQRLRDRRSDLALLMAEEMGKPLGEGESEIEKCAWTCEYYAEHAAEFLAPHEIVSDARVSRIHYEPLGVLFAVMPWNFPFWQVFRFLAPALSAGNVAILKHAPNVPGCGLAIAELLLESGFDEGVFQTLLVDHEAAQSIIADPRVAAVSFTGSTRGGRAVAETAGRHLKKVVLELGGSDPSVILRDADLDAAVKAGATSRMINAGQSCIAAKRFIVVPEIRDNFERKLCEEMSAYTMGDPTDAATKLGPLAREDLRDTLHRQVRESVDAGARVLLGGQMPERAGAYYPPTVLSEVAAGMPAYEEELFGPVAAILPARDEADAIAIANDSAYGLGAAVYTADQPRGERIAAQELEAGSCFVNAFVRSDPRLPFGGIKNSGFGRELGMDGIREFVNVKTVYVG